MDKQQLRQQIRAKLYNMSPQQILDKSQMACKKLIESEEFQNANIIMAFLSLPKETDTTPFILYSWQHAKTIAVPKVSWQQRHMIPVEINSLETGLATEAGGLRNPVTGVPVPMNDIDLVITPGLAFDDKGNRLGRGGSYYDRFFQNKNLRAVRCGFAFSEQVVEKVPTFEHDQPVDMIVTDKEVLRFNED
ncbi:MAG: 5-formyltetrahydrofolate cyclo-ligase [Anaerohalosphaeraceae bacterium]|nr:5-formyltetrahydrofolate cyclo-ligase [Anaerohalosphaeraceae bacterium]